MAYQQLDPVIFGLSGEQAGGGYVERPAGNSIDRKLHVHEIPLFGERGEVDDLKLRSVLKFTGHADTIRRHNNGESIRSMEGFNDLVEL